MMMITRLGLMGLNQLNTSTQHNNKPPVPKEDGVIQSHNKLVAAREDVAHLGDSTSDLRENAADIRENAADIRENAADIREDAAGLREDTVLLREKKVTSREGEILATKTIQAGFDEHIIKLQQANAQLVVSAMKARKLAEEVEETKVQMELSKVAAEKANLAKSVFLNHMSHELRTPLNAILGFSQLLEIGSPPPTQIQTEKLQHIIKAGWYLLELINGILDHATIEAGALSVTQEPVPLETTILECLGMVESQAKKHDIHINFIPFDKTWLVNADRIRLKQVLINLLSNAIKYNREHGMLEVKCTCTQECIRIHIKDSGMGLPPEKLAQLFEPFNRLGQEFGTEEGTGIGLVVSKQLIELMGGTINVESTIGVGSEFWVELARAEAPQLVTENKMPTELALKAHGNAMLRALLYKEDNPGN
ncbi:MAG: Signal transduction histidine kinase [Candidatus Nitrotoga sp. CP45]|nr:MAG: Signal transduction histidine kinase [Candidatus Nitrotoga sp. CP45]